MSSYKEKQSEEGEGWFEKAKRRPNGQKGLAKKGIYHISRFLAQQVG
ncbi:MAG TPA: hypothetical protein GXX31_00345 [Methanothermobacter sp.]|jgi:HEPN domain-containing protein|uniref:Uncharacterized protein n=1 Tax=Methanothermobacter tenebrarum TaxID=680118 RepID=A0ABM7YE29_9EURY|nr:hypothetical protein [Methanothermobacter tenebrarum]MDD3454715.1 hypothetical protein [Methanobacteriales archaeon]MDI6881287.1 hypothetical protein [Methanothermobacter sp.]MDX9693178.1 hypothetical protein [Methanothermobacter sp.]BDH79562.1 hypothetical protein MTTB_09410 [Methanothermobacter tenebrarum]HHW15826.1 hypothetical protein [Methanothermobacter sp.]